MIGTTPGSEDVMKKKRLLIAVVVVIVAIQLVPVDRGGAPPEQPLEAPGEVMAVLQRSCFDCHSAATIWPWYGHVAPVSWFVAHHVHEAREYLDFSRWGLMSAAEQAEMQGEIIEEVEKGAMPLPVYLTMHGEAEITPADLRVLRRWAGEDDDAGGEGHDHDHDH
jgi:hypothetical protein